MDVRTSRITLRVEHVVKEEGVTGQDETDGTVALDRHDPLPLWAQLADRLRTAIGEGRFRHRFPSEHELTARYGVSRHTVRQAVRKLEDEGLLSREQGRGTFVNLPEFRQDLGTLYSLYRTIEAQGVRQHSTVRTLEVATNPMVAHRLGLTAEDPLVHLARVRFAADQPLALDDAWLPATVAAGLLEAEFTHTALYDELLHRCGVVPTAGVEEIRPVVPSDEECHLLGVAAGTPAFALERTTRTAERIVEWRRTLLRGDRFSFIADWAGSVPAAPRLEVTG
jgi:GntR family transcriptional regulator